MSTAQPAILSELPAHARFVSFRWTAGAIDAGSVQTLLAALQADRVDRRSHVVGLGATLIKKIAAALGHALPSLLEDFVAAPRFERGSIAIESVNADLWVWLRDGSRGSLHAREQALCDALRGLCERVDSVDTFVFGEGRDLTGYVDGTENPTGHDAEAAAITYDRAPGLDGGSFAVAQVWQHDLATFAAFGATRRDHTFGRAIADNEEIGDAPESAHVKRTAQESFVPEAFVLRRSMPWVERQRRGLYFLAFGETIEAFEALMHRMIGDEDGIVDALFDFSKPEGTAYYWCPPIERDGRLDMRAVGIEQAAS